MLDEPNNYLTEKLQTLVEEQFRISELIHIEGGKPIPDELAIHRMKKQALLLKHQIDEVKSRLRPDIIA